MFVEYGNNRRIEGKEGRQQVRKESEQQRRTYVPAVASIGRLAESSSCGQSANMMLSPL